MYYLVRCFYNYKERIFKDYEFKNYVEAKLFIEENENTMVECYQILECKLMDYGCVSKSYCPEKSKCKKCFFNPDRKKFYEENFDHV